MLPLLILAAGAAAPTIDIPVVPGIPTLYHRAEPPAGGEPVPALLLSPPFDQPFLCGDHPEGDVGALGDAFGTDCMVVGGFDHPSGRRFFRLYRTDGFTNPDWYGWHARVLAPFDGTVRRIMLKPDTNVPGTMAQPPSSLMVFQRDDGVVVVYGHITSPRVKEGERVRAGQPVALDGNNGVARSPHVHVGAFKDRMPYQIRWDQRAEGRMPGFR